MLAASPDIASRSEPVNCAHADGKRREDGLGVRLCVLLSRKGDYAVEVTGGRGTALQTRQALEIAVFSVRPSGARWVCLGRAGHGGAAGCVTAWCRVKIVLRVTL